VLLAGANTVDAVIVYLAALATGHPVLLAAGDQPATVEALIAAYDPDLVVRSGDAGPRIHERHVVAAHPLHPDLALLLSTSGSTGAAKLVRLSHDNLQANATSIATYLAIGGGDRAATTLPMHYCYGVSVINSHLLRGASLLLTDHSVADPGFWRCSAPAAGPASPGCPTPSTCSTGSASTGCTCRHCATSPRPAAGWHPTACAATPPPAAEAAGTWW
jgi:hypothetical protein